MEITTVLPWITAISMLISIGTAVTVFFTSGAKQNEKKLVEHDRRIQAVENELKHLPTRDAQHQIEISLEKINGRLDTLAESLKPIKANGEMLNELLREQVKAASR